MNILETNKYKNYANIEMNILETNKYKNIIIDI